MYQLNLAELSVAEFLNQYWQKKPLLIKGGFKNFVDPLTADELAGLATEEEIESRIVSCVDKQWDMQTGPFEDFSEFGDKGWTLLVQAVDHWHPLAAKLLDPFRFIPNWRIDDLMVSFSTPGGGVGPHLDQYDVFIIQGEGKRHWRVGMPDSNLQQLCPHPRLLQVSPFVDCIDVITEPGDILYIPPGCPHDGVTGARTDVSYDGADIARSGLVDVDGAVSVRCNDDFRSPRAIVDVIKALGVQGAMHEQVGVMGAEASPSVCDSLSEVLEVEE